MKILAINFMFTKIEKVKYREVKQGIRRTVSKFFSLQMLSIEHFCK